MAKKEKDLEIFFPQGKEITIKGEKFVITELVFRTRTKVLRIVAEIIQSLAKESPNFEVDMSQGVTVLLNSAGDKLSEIYEIILDRPKEWVEDIPLRDEIALIEAIIEVNDIHFLASRIKELVALVKKQA